MAVGLAELVFFFPNAVSQLLLPQVAGAPREESDKQVATVARVTLLITGAFALLLIPLAALTIALLLPAFGASMAPLLLLLPGVVALSVAKAVGAYVSGIGRPEIDSAVSMFSLAANLAEICCSSPLYGMSGAAAASFISYTANALILTVIVARITGTRVASYWIPQVSDVRLAITMSIRLVRRLVPSARGLPDDGNA